MQQWACCLSHSFSSWNFRSTGQLWFLKICSKMSAEVPLCCLDRMVDRSDLPKDQGQLTTELWPQLSFSQLPFSFHLPSTLPPLSVAWLSFLIATFHHFCTFILPATWLHPSVNTHLLHTRLVQTQTMYWKGSTRHSVISLELLIHQLWLIARCLCGFGFPFLLLLLLRNSVSLCNPG